MKLGCLVRDHARPTSALNAVFDRRRLGVEGFSFMKKLAAGLLLLTAVVHCNTDTASTPGDAGTGGDASAPPVTQEEAGVIVEAGFEAGVDASKPADTKAPKFAGAKAATALTETDIAVTWDPATDDTTAQGTIAYRAYVAPEGTPIAYTTPFATSPAGATGMTLTALSSATKYSIVVRAVDASGNEDTNTTVVTATTKDVTPPTFGGVTKITGAGAHEVLVEWDPATDNGGAPSTIMYRVFVSQTQGGETYATPTVTSAPGATSVMVTGLAEATTVFVVVRAVDASGNSDSNKKEKPGFTLDKTPPTFAGATSATALGTSVHLTWAPATDLVDPQATLKYDVFVATTPGGQSFGAAPLTTTASGATSYTAINLNVSTTYYFVVRAKDTSGNEDTNKVEVSALTAASPDITPPSFSGLAAATAIGDTAVDLSWAAATDDYSSPANIVYDVFVAGTSNGQLYATPSYTTPPGATSFTLTGLQPLTTEYVVVRARDQAGNEDKNTKEGQATTLADKIAPSFGGLVSASPTSSTSVQLTWAAATDDITASSAITYQVYQSSTAGGEPFGSPIATTAPGAQAIAVSGLQPNTPYYYVVRAVDAVGNVDANTIEKLATTPPDTIAPLFAGASSLVALSPTSLVASWSLATDDVTPQGSIVYLPYLSTTPNGENFGVAPTVTAPNATSFTWNGLTPNTTYYVVVRARDAAGNVDTNTNEKSGATQPDTTAPTFGGAQSVGSATDSSLTVSWTQAIDNVTPQPNIVYQICITTTDGACNGGAFTSSAQVTGLPSYTFTGLSPNTAYYFVVRAVDTAAPPNSDTNSQQVSMKTAKDTSPPTFSGLATATPNGDASITLGWAAAIDDITSSGQIVYDIYQSTTPGGEAFSGASYTTAAGQTTFSIPFPPAQLTPQTAYYYVVRARDGAGNHDANVVEKTATTAPDTTPPTFGGVTSVTGPTLTSLVANWNPASDDITATAGIVYKVCWAQDTSCTTSFTAMATTAAGATSFVISGLLAGKTYNVVVRARDNAAVPNTDTNTIVRSSTTLADTTPPVFTGNPSVSNANATSLTLNWAQAHDNYSADANITYLVCYTQIATGCGGAGGAFTANGGTFVNQLSTGFSGFTPLQTYYFVVRAQDQVPNTDTNVNVVSVTMQNDTTAPTFAGLVSAAPAAGLAGDANVTLTWAQATDNVTPQASIYYDIYQSTSHITTFGAATYTVQGVSTATVPLTVPGLSPQTTYYYVVRARDSASNRDTNVVEKTALTNADTVKPSFGGITGLTPSPTNGSQMTATWNAATDDTTAAANITYLICWSTTASCTTSFVAMGFATGTTFFQTPVNFLHQNTAYTFVVRARDASAAQNTDTNTVSITKTTIADTVAPTFGGVTSVTKVAGASPIPQQNLLVSWSVANDDATAQGSIAYDICWAQAAANCTGASFVANHTSIGTTSYQITGLSPGTSYNVVVRARDEANNWNVANANTQIAQATMADSVAPTWGSPAGLQTATGTSPTSITLGWNIASDDFSSATQLTYYVYRQSPSPGLVTTVTGTVASPMSYLATGLTPNTSYCFYVQARDAAGNQDTNTNAICASTPQIPAPTFSPALPSVVSNTDTTITVNWSASVTPASTITYQVCASLVNGGCNGFTAGANVSAPYQITGLAPSKTYYILVRATDAGGSTYSSQLTASTTADGTAPTWNGTPTATPSNQYPTYLQVAWSAASDDVGVTGYELCWSTSSSGCNSWTTKFTTTSVGTWIGAGGYNSGVGGTFGTALIPNTLYYVFVRAYDAAGNRSPMSAAASATTSMSYTVNVDPIFVNNCNGCHDGLYQPGPLTYAFTVNKTAVECAHKYFVSGDGANSLIYQKVSNSGIPGGCGCTMPRSGVCGNVTLAAANQGILFTWAQAGAINN